MDPRSTSIRHRFIGWRGLSHLLLCVLCIAGCSNEDPVDPQPTGALQVVVEGLPGGVPARIQVSGPASFEATVFGDSTLTGLAAGTYELIASAVSDGGTSYNPGQEGTETVVVPGGTLSAVVHYEAQPVLGGIDLRIDGFEIVQSTQRDDNSIPLVAGRAALLRVYALASGAESSALPALRVEVLRGAAVVDTRTVSATSALPDVRRRDDLSASINFTLPTEWIEPGLSLRATIDPSNLVPEDDESNNDYPADGSAIALDVVDVGALRLRLVPVSVEGLTGRIDASTAGSYVSDLAAMFPVQDVRAEVRAPYTSGVESLGANGSGWSSVLREMLLLRQTDVSDAYYFGVVQTTYNSGAAGLAYIPSTPSSNYNVAIGWDRANSRASVLAHEVGHNLGRQHAPCGSVANADGAFPYLSGGIGEYGFDLRDGSLRSPGEFRDIMGYCNPQWISDYQYEGVLDFLGSAERSRATPSENCLVVWGEVDADGRIQLDPAFQIQARPLLPDSAGDYRVLANSADGKVLFDFPFELPDTGCLESGQSRGFVWLVPMDRKRAGTMNRIELRGRGSRTVGVASAGEEGAQSSVAAEWRQPWHLDRDGQNRVRLEWESASLPLAVVSDPRNGEVLAIARRGPFYFECDADEVLVTFSDGVRSEGILHTFQ